MDLLNRNSIWLGMGLAFIFPVMVFGVVLTLFDFATDLDLLAEVTDPFQGRRFRTTTLITICGNMILIKLYNKKFTQDTLRGILIVTFLGAAIWLGLFYDEIFTDF